MKGVKAMERQATTAATKKDKWLERVKPLAKALLGFELEPAVVPNHYRVREAASFYRVYTKKKVRDMLGAAAERQEATAEKALADAAYKLKEASRVCGEVAGL